MKVYILDAPSKSREQMLRWLSEDKRVTGVEIFEDYIRFIERIGKFPPDFCVIRLGNDGIPGLKTAGMVQQINPEIRIVFVSYDREYAVDAHEVGAYGYLLCPMERKKFDRILFSNAG